MDQFLSRFLDALATYVPKVVGALLVLLIGWWIAKMVTRIIRRIMHRTRVEETLVKFVSNLVYIGAMAFVVVAALGKHGINTASFAAVLAAAGLAVGFALQGSLANFAAGVMLIIFRPFKAGDFVEAAGVSGIVEEIQVFATILRTPDNKRVVVGNAAVTGSTITNYSAKETRRVDLVFGIGYQDDIRKAKGIIERILGEDERILRDPAPTVAVSELADSSVNLAVRPWVRTPDYWAVTFDLNEKIKLAFDSEGISIPFPQRDVHLHQVA